MHSQGPSRELLKCWSGSLWTDLNHEWCNIHSFQLFEFLGLAFSAEAVYERTIPNWAPDVVKRSLAMHCTITDKFQALSWS